jgi:toxin ParE1/3/4
MRGASDRRPRIWSPEAEEDLYSIWLYLAGAASPSIADRAVIGIYHVAFVVGGYSEFGRAREDIRPGLRSVRFERWVVFYRVRRDAIEIVRVLDERRDVDMIFPEDV